MHFSLSISILLFIYVILTFCTQGTKANSSVKCELYLTPLTWEYYYEGLLCNKMQNQIVWFGLDAVPGFIFTDFTDYQIHLSNTNIF